jgi:hypothetical protein
VEKRKGCLTWFGNISRFNTFIQDVFDAAIADSLERKSFVTRQFETIMAA